MATRGWVGLDIGTAGVRAAEVSSGKGGTTLNRFGQVGLPLGAVVNGEIVDADAVTAAIKQLWSSVKFSTKRVVVGVANQKVVVRQVELPWTTEKELRKSLGYQVADVIPMPIEQAILDVHLIEDYTTDSGSRMVRAMLAAAVREMVSTLVATVQRAGLSVVQVELTPFALLRSLGLPESSGLSERGAECLVDVGASVTTLVVHEDGVPRFVRILPLGGADLTGALGERMGVPPEEAEAVKQSMSLAEESGLPAAHPAARALESAAALWIDEVRGSLDYFSSQPGVPRVGRLVLSGGASRLGGLPERLSMATRMPVVSASPMSTLRVGKTGLTAEQLAFAEPQVCVPLGLALGRAA